MVNDGRPDPEKLLASVQQEEARRRRGRLKIFLGMCPGVGKTYAMLREGRKELDRGMDAVVGLVETHGRSETAALLEGLQVAPRLQCDYRGTVVAEMDLDAILLLRPQLVLVDELAHTNAPGCRHPKRYQDVEELLGRGINVFTTLNVQHVESRVDSVRQATGVTIHETVPDSMIEAADEIELIDLPPARLRERLAEGKVYLGDRAAAASENFFREENLVALREIALRLAAERVDQQLRSLKSIMAGAPRSGTTSGRLMVAVGPSPYSLELVRRTRRVAYSLDASWLAVSIDSGRPLSPVEQRQLDKNLALARELGAEVVFTRDENVARALLRVARENHVAQIVVGRPLEPSWKTWVQGGSLLSQLVRLGPDIDIHVVSPQVDAVPGARPEPPSAPIHWQDYGWAGLAVLVTTTVNLAISALVGYRSVALFYLLAILLLGLKVTRGPLLLSAALSALLWDFLFIPPIYTFYVAHFDDAFMLLLFFIVALVSGQLTSRLRNDEKAERQREQRASALYRLTRSIATAASVDEVIRQAVAEIRETFGVESAVYIAGSEFGLSPAPQPRDGLPLDEKEHGVAVWAYRNRKPAGRFTDTLTSAKAFHLPLLTAARAYGVLAIGPGEGRDLTFSERDLLASFAQQIALVLEQEFLRRDAESARVLAQSEELHRALFHSVSHELQTPLAILQSGLEQLDRHTGADRTQIFDSMADAIARLRRLVKNLLDSARLETGRLELKREWGEVRELIDQAIELSGPALRQAKVEIVMPEDAPLLHIDFGLVSQALANLLHNAVTYSNAPAQICIEAQAVAGAMMIEVGDRGPGIPPELLDSIFERFVRAPGVKPGGSGLGLAIARGFVEAHGGTLSVHNRTEGGAAFVLRLPLEKPPDSAKLVA